MIKLTGFQKLWCYMGFPTRVETLDELRYNYPSPYLLDVYAQKFFKYTPDSGPQDNMYPLAQAWQRFKDDTGNDCEEYAYIFWTVLIIKYNCFMTWIFDRSGKGHAVLIFEVSGWWRHLSNWGISKGTWLKLEDLYKDIYPNVASVYMVTPSSKDTYNKILIYSPPQV